MAHAYKVLFRYVYIRGRIKERRVFVRATRDTVPSEMWLVQVAMQHTASSPRIQL
jgi:hypothetical protein